MKEIWKPITEFEGFYEVSNTGKVRNIKRNKELVSCKNNHGYLQVLLCKNGKRKCVRVHKLVALAFIDNPHNYDCINHKDENKTNNYVDNLEWCTVKYNNTYGTMQQRSAEKRRKPVAKMLNGNIVAIYNSAVEANRITGINCSKIRMCCRGERKTAGGFCWKNIKD